MIKISLCEPARTYLIGTGWNEVVTSVLNFVITSFLPIIKFNTDEKYQKRNSTCPIHLKH